MMDMAGGKGGNVAIALLGTTGVALIVKCNLFFDAFRAAIAFLIAVCSYRISPFQDLRAQTILFAVSFVAAFLLWDALGRRVLSYLFPIDEFRNAFETISLFVGADRMRVMSTELLF